MIEDGDLWSDPERAQKLMRERQMLMDKVETYRRIDRELTDNVDLIELGEMEDDLEIVSEGGEEPEGAGRFWPIRKELEALLDGEADGNDTFLEINAGAGGTESRDWA